jgi:hypothetical protein
MFQRQLIDWVMDQENVAHRQRGSFQMVYESTFNDALNQTEFVQAGEWRDCQGDHCPIQRIGKGFVHNGRLLEAEEIRNGT